MLIIVMTIILMDKSDSHESDGLLCNSHIILSHVNEIHISDFHGNGGHASNHYFSHSHGTTNGGDNHVYGIHGGVSHDWNSNDLSDGILKTKI